MTVIIFLFVSLKGNFLNDFKKSRRCRFWSIHYKIVRHKFVSGGDYKFLCTFPYEQLTNRQKIWVDDFNKQLSESMKDMIKLSTSTKAIRELDNINRILNKKI